MSSISMDKKDEIVMKLVHFLVTKENYTPIVVNGVRNEVWLENVEGPYKIIRINSNYIHNKEQFNFDIYKTNNVARQIKKKISILLPNTAPKFICSLSSYFLYSFFIVLLYIRKFIHYMSTYFYLFRHYFDYLLYSNHIIFD